MTIIIEWLDGQAEYVKLSDCINVIYRDEDGLECSIYHDAWEELIEKEAEAIIHAERIHVR